MVNISLDNTVVDTERKTFKSSYLFDVQDLKKLHKVIDQKLYGPLVLRGEWTKDKKLTTVTGETTTLGGKIDYTLIGDDLSSTINNVPLENILGIPAEEIISVSAKEGTNAKEVLQRVIEKVPPPKIAEKVEDPTETKALIFDSVYDPYRGVVVYVRVTQEDGHMAWTSPIYLVRK